MEGDLWDTGLLLRSRRAVLPNPFGRAVPAVAVNGTELGPVPWGEERFIPLEPGDHDVEVQVGAERLGLDLCVDRGQVAVYEVRLPRSRFTSLHLHHVADHWDPPG